jgi:hypothetical protein
MDIEQIRDAYHTRPFRAFYLVLADGRRLEVYDDCCMAIAPSGREMIVLDRRGRWTFVQPTNVVALEFAPATVTGNPAAPPAA